jgi:histidine triad (HIT) family protein
MAYRDWYCEDVLSGKIEVKKLWEDERVLAFLSPQPESEIHVVVIPKAHVPSLLDPMALDGALLSSMMLAVQHVARELGLDQTGFYVRANAAAPGVTPHMHWHVRGPGIP